MVETKSFLDSLFETPQAYGIQVSPDCKWVAWSWANIAPVANIYLAPIDGSAKPVRITDFKQDTSIYSWSFDSQSLVVGHDIDGDERVTLFRISINDLGKPERLTEEKPDYFLRGGRLHPDGKSLIYGANYDFEKGESVEQTVIYRHNLRTNERQALARPKRAGGGRPQLNSKGTHIIYARNDIDPSGKQIWMVDVEGKEDQEILNFGDKTEIDACWSPDGETVIFLADYQRVGIWSLTDKTVRWLIDSTSRNIEGAWMPEGSNEIVVLEVVKAVSQVSLIHPETKAETPLPAPRTSVPIGKISSSEWLITHYNSIQPTEIAVYNSEKKEIVRPITEVWERVTYKPEELVKAENFTWKSIDGLEIQGWLYKVPGKAKGTIVHVHGGPTSHDEDSFAIQTQYFLSEGFNVLEPNYRGSTGFGLEFQDLIKKDGWGGKEQDDIITGIKALIERGIAEPYKIGITGTSYGGYSSWFAITHNSPDIIAASAPICGMTDLVIDYETTRPDLRIYSEAMMGGTPQEVPQIYQERSPINYLKDIQGKLLIIQGARDPNVTPENVRAVREELEKNKVPYEILMFEDEGHGIGRPVNRKILLKRLVEFFYSAFEK